MVDSIYGYTMLMIKVEEGNLREVKNIRKKYPNEDINIQNKAGQTALTLAARGGFPEIAEHLIQQGADVNVQNKSGQTPLFVACWYNHAHLVDLLLSYNADVNIADSRGWTPIIAACHNNNLEIVKLLLKTEPDVRTFDCFGKRARERAKNSKIIKLVGELEKKQDLIEDPEFFADSPRSGRRKSMIRRTSKRSTSRKSNSKTPKRFTFGSPDRSPISRDVSCHRSPSRKRDASLSDDLSPLRTAPQFIHGIEYFKPYETSGSYKKARSKSKKAKKLFGSDSETLKKLAQQRKSVENLTEINPSPKSQSGYDTIGETLNLLRTPKAALKSKPRYSCFNTEEKQYQGKGEDEFGTTGSMRMSDLGKDTHYTSNPESFFESMRSFNKTREEVDNLLRKSKEIPFSLKSVGSLASTERTNFKSGYKSRSDISSLNDLSIMNGEDDVLSSKLKELFKLFIKNLYDRMHTALDKGVAEDYENEMDRFGKITEEKFHQIIMEKGGKITEKVISNFQDLLEDLMRDFNLGKDLSKTLEDGTEMLIRNMTADAENEMYQHVLRKVNGPSRTILPNRSLNRSAWEKVQFESNKDKLNNPDDHSNFMNDFKQNAMNQLNEIFAVVDDTLLDKPRHQKGKLSYLACQEVLEGLNNVKSNFKELLENGFSSSKFKTQPLIQNSEKSTQTNLAAHHQRATQTIGTSTLLDRFRKGKLNKGTDESISDSQELSRTSSKKSLTKMPLDVLNIMIQPNPSNSNKVLNANKWTSFKIPTKSYESQGDSNRSLNDSCQESNQSFSSFINSQEQENRRKHREKIQNNKDKLPVEPFGNNSHYIQTGLSQKKQERKPNQELKVHKRELTFGPEVEGEIGQRKSQNSSFEDQSSIDNSHDDRIQNKQNEVDQIDDKLSLSVKSEKDFTHEETEQEIQKIDINKDLYAKDLCNENAFGIENVHLGENKEKELSEKGNSGAEEEIDRISEIEDGDALITKDKMRDIEWLENNSQLESVAEDLDEEKAEDRKDNACEEEEQLNENLEINLKPEEIIKPQENLQKDECLEESVESELNGALQDNSDKLEVEGNQIDLLLKTLDKEEVNEPSDFDNENQKIEIVQCEDTTKEVTNNVQESNGQEILQEKDDIKETENNASEKDMVNIVESKNELPEVEVIEEEVAGSVDNTHQKVEIAECKETAENVQEDDLKQNTLDEKDQIQIDEIERIKNSSDKTAEPTQNESEENDQVTESIQEHNLETIQIDENKKIEEDGQKSVEIIEVVEEGNITREIQNAEENELNQKTVEKKNDVLADDINESDDNTHNKDGCKVEYINYQPTGIENVDQEALNMKDRIHLDDAKESEINIVNAEDIVQEAIQDHKLGEMEIVAKNTEFDELVEIKENESVSDNQINETVNDTEKDDQKFNAKEDSISIHSQEKIESQIANDQEIINKDECLEDSVDSQSAAVLEDNSDKVDAEGNQTDMEKEVNESADVNDENQNIKISQGEKTTAEVSDNIQESNGQKVFEEKEEIAIDDIKGIENNAQDNKIQQNDALDTISIELNKDEKEEIKIIVPTEVAKTVDNDSENQKVQILEFEQATKTVNHIQENDFKQNVFYEKDQIQIGEIEENKNDLNKTAEPTQNGGEEEDQAIESIKENNTIDVNDETGEEGHKTVEIFEVPEDQQIQQDNDVEIERSIKTEEQDTEQKLQENDTNEKQDVFEELPIENNLGEAAGEENLKESNEVIRDCNNDDKSDQASKAEFVEENSVTCEDIDKKDSKQESMNNDDQMRERIVDDFQNKDNEPEIEESIVSEEAEKTKQTEEQKSCVGDDLKQPVLGEKNEKYTGEGINQVEKIEKEDEEAECSSQSKESEDESDSEIDEFDAEKEFLNDRMDKTENEEHKEILNSKKDNTLEIIAEEGEEDDADNKHKHLKENKTKQREVIQEIRPESEESEKLEIAKEDLKLNLTENTLSADDKLKEEIINDNKINDDLLNVPQNIIEEEIQSITTVNQGLEEESCIESQDLPSKTDEKIKDPEILAVVESENFGRQQPDDEEGCEVSLKDNQNEDEEEAQNDKKIDVVGPNFAETESLEDENKSSNNLVEDGSLVDINEEVNNPHNYDKPKELENEIKNDQISAEPINNKEAENIQECIVLPEIEDSNEGLSENNKQNVQKQVLQPQSLIVQNDFNSGIVSTTKDSTVATLPSIQTITYLDNYKIPQSPDSSHSSEGISDFDKVFKTFDDVMYKPNRNNVIPSEPILEKPLNKEDLARKREASNKIENVETKISIVSAFPSFQLNNYLDSYKISPSSPHSSEGESDFDSIYKTFDAIMYKPDRSNLAPSEPVNKKPINHEIGFNKVNQNVSQKFTSGNVNDTKKAVMESRAVLQHIRSFTQNAGYMIPTPTPSRFVVKTVDSSIDNIPHSKKFEIPGQSDNSKALPLKTVQKEYVETHVITKEWSM